MLKFLMPAILRYSIRQEGGLNPIHLVSGFAARQRLVLGQVKVAQKSNEIVAIPKLLTHHCEIVETGNESWSFKNRSQSSHIGAMYSLLCGSNDASGGHDPRYLARGAGHHIK